MNNGTDSDEEDEGRGVLTIKLGKTEAKVHQLKAQLEGEQTDVWKIQILNQFLDIMINILSRNLVFFIFEHFRALKRSLERVLQLFRCILASKML